MDCRLTAINQFPIKSLQGVSCERALVTDRGLRNDRRWMLTDAKGEFLTQRSNPRLARIRVELTSGGLTVSAPGLPPLDLVSPAGDHRRQVKVWRDRVDAAAAGPGADAWFSRCLDRPCCLVHMDEKALRPVRGIDAHREHQVSFADGYPCLLVSEASLELLNSRLDLPVPMDRFRANLVVTGCEAHAEDRWARLRVGEAVLRSAGPCARCVVTTVDQATGVVSERQEPLRTLATYRSSPEGVLFGMNLVVEEPGWIEVGMQVEVLEKQHPPT